MGVPQVLCTAAVSLTSGRYCCHAACFLTLKSCADFREGGIVNSTDPGLSQKAIHYWCLLEQAPLQTCIKRFQTFNRKWDIQASQPAYVDWDTPLSNTITQIVILRTIWGTTQRRQSALPIQQASAALCFPPRAGAAWHSFRLLCRGVPTSQSSAHQAVTISRSFPFSSWSKNPVVFGQLCLCHFSLPEKPLPSCSRLLTPPGRHQGINK